MKPQEIQSNTQGCNREELSTESSLEELSQEELLTITGGSMVIGAGVGALVGAGAMGGTIAGIVKKDGGTTEQALGYGAATGAVGGLLGAGGGAAVGGIKNYNDKIKMLQNLKR